MHPNLDPAASGTSERTTPELVIQNGRLKGTRQPLNGPLTVIGRLPGSDLRLNVEGVSPLHCVLVQGAEGLALRDLHSVPETQVNGRPATSCPLKDGDMLTVGPFQFQVRVKAPTPAQLLADAYARHSQEKDALRIQAAAVAAQQAAVTEEESKVYQAKSALERQEAQLAKHLDEKRSRLIEVRDEARAACAELKEKRAAEEKLSATVRKEMETAQRELADAQKNVQVERERLLKLTGRMKRRWHRHWSAERATMKRREDEVGRRNREIENEKERVQQERQGLQQARLQFNGEVELGRRQLQAQRQTFHQEQLREEQRQERLMVDIRARERATTEREVVLSEAEQQFEEQKLHWQEVRLELEREVEGLENRSRNYRRKIGEMEAEVVELEKKKTAEPVKVEGGEEKKPEEIAGAAGEASPPVPVPVVEVKVEVPAPAVAAAPAAAVAKLQAEVEDVVAVERIASLERLAGELADQRMHLLEQCQRMIEGQQRWQQDRDAAAADLEVIGKELQLREVSLLHREQSIEGIERRLQQQQMAAADMQRHLEGWQSRMTAREISWEGERDRLMAEVQSRGTLAEQRLSAVALLHQRWTRRRRKELQWVQSERVICAKLRREYVLLRDDFLRRQAVLEKEQRSVAERSLALEEFQQELLDKSAHPARATRRLEKLRQQWSTQATAALKSVEQERKMLDSQANQLEEYHERLKKQAARLDAREGEVATLQSAMEQAQLQAQDELNHFRSTLSSSQIHQERYEKQVVDLRDEVERLARLLLDEAEPIVLSAAKAA